MTLIIPGSATATGIALSTYRQRLARTLGYYATGTVTTEASSLEAERYILSSNIRSDAMPPEQWDGLYVHITNGDQAGTSRKLVNGSWDGPLGALVVDYPFDASLDVGTTFEVAVLPGLPYLGVTGWREIINEGLETLPLLDVFPITVTTSSGLLTTEYSLAGYSWPIKGVEAVYYPRTNASTQRRIEMPKCWDFNQDGEAPILSFRSLPAGVGDEIEVGVLRPAHTRIRQSGAWGNVTTGLVNDSDQALYDAVSVVNASRPIALQRWALRYERGSKERASLEGEAADDAVKAMYSKFYGGFKRSGAQRAGARW